jgi:signal transduction histidine kinase
MRYSMREQWRAMHQRFMDHFSVEQRLAMKFTRLVCAIILVSGAIFTAADGILLSRRMMRGMNAQIDEVLASGNIADNPASADTLLSATLKPFIRVLSPDGTVLYQGELFADAAPGPVDPFATVKVGPYRYAVYSTPVRKDGHIVAYLQVAGSGFQGSGDFVWKFVELLGVTVVMGALSYVLGLRFSCQTLLPVHQAQDRLEQFTQDASHELRTPLASISASLDVALKTGDYEQGIVAAKSQVKYSSLLVERLLEVARLDRTTLDLGPVDLSSLVTAVASQHAEACRERDLTMSTKVDERVFVEGDGLLLRQLVNNLIENAVKFNEPGGTVTVALDGQGLRVCNSGGFIDQDDIPCVFDPFYQVDASHAQRGFGLGLAIVKKIAILHGWHLTVSSTAEAGTEFAVTFARVRAERETP